MPTPLVSERRYPPLFPLTKDAYSARIISSAYATSAGELNSALQLSLHAVNFTCEGDESRAQLLKSIAAADAIHLSLLSEALMRLGTQPIYSSAPPTPFNFYSAKFVACPGSMRSMVEDDVVSKRYSIYCYERMLSRLKCDLLKNLVCRILEDEHLHLEKLKQTLINLND